MDKIFRWAVIGTGNIARNVMNEVCQTGRHKVAVVFSRTAAKAVAFADKFGACVAHTLEEAIQYDGVDGVYVATPHSAHYGVMLASLAAQKPVLCEKSFTVNAAQAEKICGFSQKNQVYCCEAMWTRFNPIIKAVRKLAEEGSLGKIVGLKASFCTPIMKLPKSSRTERIDSPDLAGGALLDLGVYPISFAQMLLGVPDSAESKMVLSNGVDMREEITLNYGNVKAHLRSGMDGKDGIASYSAKVKFEKGWVWIPFFFRPSFALIYKKGKLLPQVLHCKQGYIYEFDAVADDIYAGRIENKLITHADTVAVMKIMDGIRADNGLKYPEEIENL